MASVWQTTSQLHLEHHFQPQHPPNTPTFQLTSSCTAATGGLVHTNPSPNLTPPHTRSAHTPEGGLSAVLTSPHTEGEAWGGSTHHQATHNHNPPSAAKHQPQEVKLSSLSEDRACAGCGKVY